jgi:hypothetical protein
MSQYPLDTSLDGHKNLLTGTPMNMLF